MNVTLVRNELLCYASDCLKRHPADDVRQCILDFYSANAVNEAKALLWKLFTDDLPDLIKRNSHGAKTAKEKETDDIIKSLNDLHTMYASSEMPYCFVAANLALLPQQPSSHLNSVQMMERLVAVEQHLLKLNGKVAALESPSVITQAMHSSPSSTLTYRKSPVPAAASYAGAAAAAAAAAAQAPVRAMGLQANDPMQSSADDEGYTYYLLW